MSLLEVSDLRVSFGGLRAVDGFSLSVEPRTIFGLIGPNGAGKTTVLNVISRFVQPDRGSVRFQGIELLRQPAHALTRLGLARTFQNVELFRSMTVLETLLVGQHHLSRTGLPTWLWPPDRALRPEAAARRAAGEALDLLGLGDLRHRPVTSLPFGLQKRVEVARALVAQPKLILLDEPAAGLNPAEVEDLSVLTQRIAGEMGIAVLLVEHDMGMVMSVCDTVCVMEFGSHVATGAPAEIQVHSGVIAAYLGAEEESNAGGA